MAKWFGKAGNGMHVACCIFRGPDGNLIKRTYILFIGKAAQDVAAVMSIYAACLKQIKKDVPHITKLVDKSDNAGCYHTETLFAWKYHWPPKNVGMQFIETMFNERQAGKDQCDRDSATAKRQMNYYIEQGKNIETAEQMNDALRTATALCGFNSMVMEIDEKKKYENEKNIKDLSKIHQVKYVVDDRQPQYHVWQYYGIGNGKSFKVGKEPEILKHTIKVPFESNHTSYGRASKASKKEIIYCSEPMCVKSFSSVDLMLKHLNYGKHEYQSTKSSQMDRVKDGCSDSLMLTQKLYLVETQPWLIKTFKVYFQWDGLFLSAPLEGKN